MGYLYDLVLGLGFRAMVRVYRLRLVRFYQFYCTLVVLYCTELLLRHRWRMNKFSNFKIHRCIHSHCQ